MKRPLVIIAGEPTRYTNLIFTGVCRIEFESLGIKSVFMPDDKVTPLWTLTTVSGEFIYGFWWHEMYKRRSGRDVFVI